MLSKLYIKNYILISELEIDLNKGFTTITGETGAGKSILLGAVSLITGQRADTNVLLNKEQKCIVEGFFDVSDFNLQKLFNELNIDYEPNTIIRREINAKGKSRAFVNDTPVSVSNLKQLGEKLIDIHSQHNNILSNNKGFYLQVIDAYSGLKQQVSEYSKTFSSYKIKFSELEKLENEIAKAKQDLDYYQYRFNQLDEANLVIDEETEIETDLNKLNNAEEIKTNLSSVYQELSENDTNIISALKNIENLISNINKLGIDTKSHQKRIQSVIVEIQDIADDLDTINSGIEYDVEKIELLNEKLNLIFSLHQKFGVNTNKDLIKIKDELSEKLSGFAIDETKAEKLKNEIEKQKTELFSLANNISKIRKLKKSEIETYIVKVLVSLGIKNAVFKIDIETGTELLKSGVDKVKFLFSANKNIETSDILKSASGGEVSRIMLSLKSLLAKTTNLPTIIFDEIDTGVSGEIAAKMAEIMHKLSSTTQVISITHLPQIAVKGNEQFVVYKDDSDKKSQTKISKLNQEDRINEIAKMLSGKELSAAAVENAKALLN